MRGGAGWRIREQIKIKEGGSPKKEPVDEQDDDDEYVDDEFDVEDESGSNYPTIPQPAANLKHDPDFDQATDQN